MAAECISQQPSDESHSLFTIAEYGGELLLLNATRPYAITRFVRCICNADAIKPMTAKPAASNQKECIVGQLLLVVVVGGDDVGDAGVCRSDASMQPNAQYTLNTNKTAVSMCVVANRSVGRSLHDSEATRALSTICLNEAPVYSASKICPAGQHV